MKMVVFSHVWTSAGGCEDTVGMAQQTKAGSRTGAVSVRTFVLGLKKNATVRGGEHGEE